jgi:small conductance mechanosensitive channel
MATVGFFQHPPSVRSRTIPTGTEDASVAVHVFAVLLSVVLIAMPVPVASQTQNSSTPSASEEPNAPEGDRNQSYIEAATDPNVSNADLRKMLTPLTAAQISQVTEGWQIILQENVQRTVDLQRSLKNLDNAETQIARRNLVELDDDRSRIQRNYSSALQAWTKKGGSVEETKPYRDYLTALTSELIYVTDNWALVESAVRWTFSTSGGLDFIKKIGIVVFSIWAIRLAARVLAQMSKKALDRQRELSEALKSFVPRIVYWGTFVVGLMFLLSGLGFYLGPILTVFGGLSIVVAFAMQETLGNLAAGLMIMVFKPFDFGDFVEMSGISGEVYGMSIISTTIRTFDNKFIIVPNSTIWGDVITNVNAAKTRRVDMVFRIGYEDDVDKAKAILMDLCTTHEKVLETPAPSVFMAAIDESSVNLNCRPWVATADYWSVYWDLIDKGKKAFDAEGVSTPLPQKQVHIVDKSPPDDKTSY